MVASLQDTSLEEECFTQALLESHIPVAHTHSHSTSHNLPHYASALPLSHESAMKWFYKDPQGEIQGDSDYHVNLGGFLCVNYSIKCGLYCCLFQVLSLKWRCVSGFKRVISPQTCWSNVAVMRDFSPWVKSSRCGGVCLSLPAPPLLHFWWGNVFYALCHVSVINHSGLCYNNFYHDLKS